MHRPIIRARLLIGILLLAGANKPYEVKLNAEACLAPTPALLGGLGRDWQVLADFVQDCPVDQQDTRLRTHNQ
jgi:hypothetical protein